MKLQGKRIMSIKNIFKNKFVWLISSILALIVLAVMIVPPMINLNYIKPKIENIITNKTGVSAKINGNINFSLVGTARIIAHNISVPNGMVESAEFSIPFFDIFDIQNANISGDIIVNGASLLIEKIVPFTINTKIIVNNSAIQFLNKEYNIIYAEMSDSDVNAIVRTDQHKYEIKSHNNSFVIKNKNNDLHLSGELFDDGTATAHIEIIAQNINRWFEFDKPRITGQFPVVADMTWDGKYGVNFYNISANGVTGDVEFHNNGYKTVKLKSRNANYDLSFFLYNPDILKNATFNLDFYGDLRFVDKKFHHVKIMTVGTEQEIKINTIIADEMRITGGTIDAYGAHNLYVSLPENGVNTTCIFNGSPTKWSCDKFSYGQSLYGNISVDKKTFITNVYSTEKISDIKAIINSAKRFGNIGIIKFDFPDMAGTIKINRDTYDIKYEFVHDKNLLWANIDLPFLPETMLKEDGDFVWEYDSMIFIPKSETWQIATKNDFFTIHGNNFKQWFNGVDLQFLRDMPYMISGKYRKNNISNLTIEIDGFKFTGSASNKSITLKTDVLDIDSVINAEFFDNYEELAFFVAHPLTIPFELKSNIALSADALIYNKQTYDNFIYSKRDNTQNFSISDSNRGNLLATINKNKTKYALNIQLNKFVFNEKLLPENTPLNISDTDITAEINLDTSGLIARDIIDNMHGTFDASFDGGIIYGLGLDNFYATANDITSLNAEQRLSAALNYGTTNIKKMHIMGIYNNGDIKTIRPLTLSMKHVDASGALEIDDNEMFAQIQLVLRGTSSGVEPIDLTIYANNKREFSLSQIMMHFDAEYMRTFIQNHNKF